MLYKKHCWEARTLPANSLIQIFFEPQAQAFLFRKFQNCDVRLIQALVKLPDSRSHSTLRSNVLNVVASKNEAILINGWPASVSQNTLTGLELVHAQHGPTYSTYLSESRPSGARARKRFSSFVIRYIATAKAKQCNMHDLSFSQRWLCSSTSSWL
jgi:hypothetical protein